MKKLTLLLILFLILYSCQLFRENGIEVEIENNSDTPISDVKFTTTEDLNAVDFRSIDPKEKVSDFLTMSDNRLDGSYTLEFTRANGKKEINTAVRHRNTAVRHKNTAVRHKNSFSRIVRYVQYRHILLVNHVVMQSKKESPETGRIGAFKLTNYKPKL